jgi:ribosomal protein S18 acetylase RimI-like enzyme
VDLNNNDIIGSIRSYEENGRVYVGKLMVHTDYQNKGFGKKLLKAIETFYENKTFELFTSSKSEKNIQLYKKVGYKEYKRERIKDNLEMIFMEK